MAQTAPAPPRPRSRLAGAGRRVAIPLGVLVLAVGGWLGYQELHSEGPTVDGVRFTGSFPDVPSARLPRFTVVETSPSVTPRVATSTFGFTAADVVSVTRAGDRVEYTSPARHGGGLARRLTVSPSVGHRLAVLEFWTSGGTRADHQPGPPANHRLVRRAEAVVTDTLTALRLDPGDWRIEAGQQLSRSGVIWVHLTPVVDTDSGPLQVGGVASGLAGVSRSGELQSLWLVPCSFTPAPPADVIPAAEAWRTYTRRGSDEVPSSEPATYDEAELVLAVFGTDDGEGTERIARPAWAFRGHGVNSLILSADESAEQAVAWEADPLTAS